MTEPYPKPGKNGGRLIRRILSELRCAGFTPGISSYILIANSAGPDSSALAHIIAKYGRRVAQPKKISLLHIHHGWRGEEADEDARFVEYCARSWGVGFILHHAETPASYAPGSSWEEQARAIRKRIFAEEAEKNRALVITAHHGDDLAETLLWRLFTGAAETHGAGILRREGHELRPLLSTRKQELVDYLKEEGLTWRDDKTNESPRFLRARIRTQLLPKIEEIFPKAVPHLMELGLRAQQPPEEPQARPAFGLGQFAAAFDFARLRVRRAHWRALLEKTSDPLWTGELSLPRGWKLTRTRETAHFRKPLKTERKLD